MPETEAAPLSETELHRLRLAVRTGLVLNEHNAPLLVAQLLATLDRSTVPDEGALREALGEAVRILSGGHSGYVGDHYIREVQVNQSTVDRLQALLRSTRAAATPKDESGQSNVDALHPPTAAELARHRATSKDESDAPLDVERLAAAWANVMDGRRIEADGPLAGVPLTARIGRHTTTRDDWAAIAREYAALSKGVHWWPGDGIVSDVAAPLGEDR